MEDLRLDFVDSNRALLISISTERGKQQSQLLIPVVGAMFNWQLHCELVGLATGCRRLGFLVCQLVNRPFHKVSMVFSCDVAGSCEETFIDEVSDKYHSICFRNLNILSFKLVFSSFMQDSFGFELLRLTSVSSCARFGVCSGAPLLTLCILTS
jgi:hypothetical protein